MVGRVLCPDCGGEREISGDACRACAGTGLVDAKMAIKDVSEYPVGTVKRALKASSGHIKRRGDKVFMVHPKRGKAVSRDA